MDDPGTASSGRIVTMACRENELAGESGSVENGFYTYLVVDEGMLQGLADADGDGTVTVEEAFEYCSSNMRSYSPSQRPVMNDQYPGELNLD